MRKFTYATTRQMIATMDRLHTRYYFAVLHGRLDLAEKIEAAKRRLYWKMR